MSSDNHALHDAMQCNKTWGQRFLDPLNLILLVSLAMPLIIWVMVYSMSLSTAAWVELFYFAKDPSSVPSPIITTNLQTSAKLTVWALMAQIIGSVLLLLSMVWIKFERKQVKG